MLQHSNTNSCSSVYCCMLFYLSFVSPLQWKQGHTPVCNIKPTHLSVKCTLTSPLSHTRSISRCFQNHKVTLSESCFRRRPTQECVQQRYTHTITNTHTRPCIGTGLHTLPSILQLSSSFCFSPKTFLSSFVSLVILFFPFF